MQDSYTVHFRMPLRLWMHLLIGRPLNIIAVKLSNSTLPVQCSPRVDDIPSGRRAPSRWHMHSSSYDRPFVQIHTLGRCKYLLFNLRRQRWDMYGCLLWFVRIHIMPAGSPVVRSTTWEHMVSNPIQFITIGLCTTKNSLPPKCFLATFFFILPNDSYNII